MGVFKDLLGSGIGAIIGGMVGGPMGAKIGGALAGAALNEDNRFAGALSGFGIGALAPGAMNMAGMMAGGDPNKTSMFAKMFTNSGAQDQAAPAIGGAATGSSTETAGGGRGLGALGDMLGGKGGDLVLAALLANEKKGGINTLTPEQEYTMRTGERTDYVGQPIYGMKDGGYIEGPGSGTSDSIPAMIYQDGGPVQEARLSDGEFVMTEDAVRGAGMGDRDAGAAKMYQMMNQFERRA